MNSPLSDLKILDFSTLLPGPYASLILVDLGAEVLTVKKYKSNNNENKQYRTDFYNKYLGRSKKSIVLDLNRERSIKIIEKLIMEYDIILEQYRPGVMSAFGLDFTSLSKINPKIIYCSLTGYGQTGPLSKRAGHDINYLSLSGVSSYSGKENSGPSLSGIQIADIAGGSHNVVMGILAAYINRLKTDKGQYIDISITDGAFALNSIHLYRLLRDDVEPSYESSLLNGGSFYNYYETKDYKYLSVGSLEPKFFKIFCKILNIPDNTPNVNEIIKEKLKEKGLTDWIRIFGKYDVCVEPVLSLRESMSHPQLLERGMIVDIPTKDNKIDKQVANPIKFSNLKMNYKHSGSPYGTDTKEILSKLGYSNSSILKLYEDNIIG